MLGKCLDFIGYSHDKLCNSATLGISGDERDIMGAIERTHFVDLL
jgi:hypothetical protein